MAYTPIHANLCSYTPLHGSALESAIQPKATKAKAKPVAEAVKGAASVELDSLRLILTALKPWIIRKRKGEHHMALTGLLIESDGTTLRFSAANKEARLSAHVPAIGPKFSHLVDLDLVKKLLGKRKGAASFKSVDGSLELTVGSRTASLGDTFPAEAYPTVPTIGADGVMVDIASWDAVGGVLPAASGDESRPILNGAFFDDDGSVAATDSYRLYVTEGVASNVPKGGALVPAERLGRLLKLADMSGGMGVGNNWAQFEGIHKRDASVTFTASLRLIHGEYVNYKGLIPSSFEHSLEVNACLLYTSPSPRDQRGSRMPSSA